MGILFMRCGKCNEKFQEHTDNPKQFLDDFMIDGKCPKGCNEGTIYVDLYMTDEMLKEEDMKERGFVKTEKF